MKKIIMFLLVSLFCLVWVACGNNAPTGPENVNTTTANDGDGYPPPPPPGGGGGG